MIEGVPMLDFFRLSHAKGFLKPIDPRRHHPNPLDWHPRFGWDRRVECAVSSSVYVHYSSYFGEMISKYEDQVWTECTYQCRDAVM
jgi:hypothetical protein